MATEAMVNKSPMELLAMGKKAFWAHEYSDAAAYLSRSSEMLMDEYKDDKHNSLGDVYLYYGKALLELVREDGDPLGDAVPKEIELEDETAEEEDVGEQDNDEGGTADRANESVDSVGAGGEEDGGNDDQDDAKNKSELANISINGEPATSRAMEDEEDGETPAEDAAAPKEEEPTDLQLAWEVLEMAKIILERRGEEGRLDYAECLVALGEVSMEGENFESAIADITAALEIQQERYTESKDKRHLAETYYKLGMALSANNNIQESINNYRKTVELLKNRMAVLEAIEIPGTSDANEIKDITNLLPDLDEKITDLCNYQTEAAATIKPEEEAPTVSSPVKMVNNITHLVRRKRKLEDVAVEAAEIAAKKAAAGEAAVAAAAATTAVAAAAASSCSSSSSSSGSASSTNTSTESSASPDASSTSSSSNASN
ncbi:PREDICTED: protein HGV2 [Nicrophorus vespilloides]|uniref:Protein HGV2 n=1 Tax=Nicrophorus vespilloides TaxID=110193 RepID=A0ABM1MCG2_NICVS|nr:PREDICTED: protein HGV2 [Nicrophorus vespilloides]XP_017772261.1 PREDICTED: protein HGV2 [Nicrophorus vespilloides]XP_017772262.1 PREDICTED: protein HGV2 [Nicrophorus vespilloides]